ncbi:MAG: hypothetical protein OXF41_11810 [bacterium]|nr:hypothetical protein [bacterium]
MAETDAPAVSVELSTAAYPCAREVGLVPADDVQAAATLASAGVDGPLLLVGDGITDLVAAELERLAPDTLLIAGLGGYDMSALSGYEVEFLDIDEQAVLIASPLVVPDHFWLITPPGSNQGLQGERPIPRETWLVDGDTAVGAVAVAATNLGAAVVVVEGDLRALPAKTRRLLAQSEELRLLSDFDEQAAWQLEVVRHGAEIPGGGLLMFEEASPRRLVAIYGHPETSALGVLGEQDPQGGVERLSEIAAGYGADARLTEDAIIEWLGYGRSSKEAGADRLAAALTLLTIVAARLWKPEMALTAVDDWFPVRAGGHQRLGMQRFFTQLRLFVGNGATVRDVAEWLTLEYVIAQHERVATAKLSTTGDTFRFRREAGRLRFFSKGERVGMNDSRFNALATFLFELGWSGYLYEKDHELSDEGEEMRLAGDLPPTGAFDTSGPEYE